MLVSVLRKKKRRFIRFDRRVDEIQKKKKRTLSHTELAYYSYGRHWLFPSHVTSPSDSSGKRYANANNTYRARAQSISTYKVTARTRAYFSILLTRAANPASELLFICRQKIKKNNKNLVSDTT